MNVTGVQTCALPISEGRDRDPAGRGRGGGGGIKLRYSACPRHRGRLNGLALLTSLTLATLSYMVFEAQWLRLHRLRLELPGLPASLAGLKILHISDLHAGVPWPNERAIAKLVPAALEAAPDLVLFTGDMTDKKKSLEPYLEMLSRIRAPLGKYAVLGNHDHGLRKSALHEFTFGLLGRKISGGANLSDDEVATTVTRNRDLLGLADITLLNNECVNIRARDVPLQICGIDEFEYGLADMDATRKQEDRQQPLRILLSHSPDIISRSEGRRVGKECRPRWSPYP